MSSSLFKIAIVASIVVQYDAISKAVRDTWRALRDLPGLEITVFSYCNNFPEMPAQVVGGISELLKDKAFLDADLIIYHFGIYSDLFDAMIVGNGRARQVARFHNITPIDLVRAEQRPIIENSFRQLQNLRHADEVWADSETNKQVLLDHGFADQTIEVVPLCVDGPELFAAALKSAAPLNILFVGRAVRSKGLLDAIFALRTAASVHPDLRFSVVSNLAFSDADYLEECRRAIDANGLGSCVTFLPSIDDEGLAKAYREAHILLLPTYHEGFCVPAVEALRAGAIPVGYAAGNMTSIVSGLGRLVPTGDRSALTEALVDVAGSLMAPRTGDAAPTLHLDGGDMTLGTFDEAAKRYARTFSPEIFKNVIVSRVSTLLR